MNKEEMVKIFITNITKDEKSKYSTLHRVTGDCTSENGKTEKQVCRTLSSKEYASVRARGFYLVEKNVSAISA